MKARTVCTCGDSGSLPRAEAEASRSQEARMQVRWRMRSRVPGRISDLVPAVNTTSANIRMCVSLCALCWRAEYAHLQLGLFRPRGGIAPGHANQRHQGKQQLLHRFFHLIGPALRARQVVSCCKAQRFVSWQFVMTET